MIFKYCSSFLLLLLSATILLILESCTSDQLEEVDCDVSGPTLNIGEVIDAGCQPTGSITVESTGGQGELLYSLDGINFQTSPTFSELSSGDYTITVVDENNCTGVVMTSVSNASSDLNFTASTTTGGCKTSEGSITVMATGGAGEYTYRLDNGNFVASNTFENISGGSYTISVKDGEGCIHNATVRVQSGISFSTTVKPIIDNNCSVVTCHGNDPTLLSFSTHNEISQNAQRIRTQVANGTMPPDDNKLSQTQVDQILCWIDDGAMNN